MRRNPPLASHKGFNAQDQLALNESSEARFKAFGRLFLFEIIASVILVAVIWHCTSCHTNFKCATKLIIAEKGKGMLNGVFPENIRE